MNTKNIRALVICSLLAAVTAILSQIVIPLPFTPVPINMATFAVFLSGALMGAKNGALTQIVYVALGAIGVPVFAGFTGGLGKLAGYTGGYLIGYIAAAFLTGFIISKLNNKPSSYPIAMLAGLFVCYALGTAWFMMLTKNRLWESLIMCVFPYLIGDGLKIALASFLAYKLKPILLKQ